MPYQDLGVGSTAPPKLSWAGLFGPAPKSGTKVSYGDDSLNTGSPLGLFSGGFDLGTPFNSGTSSGGSGGSSGGGVATVLKDGKSDFLNLFSALSQKALGSIGAQVEPTQVAYPTVADRQNSAGGGLPPTTLLLIGAVGVGIYLYSKG
ncbi:hypothetical protein G5B38_02360 [Pseudohalocynthiibacter aestuariivivens]|nr:hypothetical protein [Pseudohalocynthiibacter aestuariivivens]QIE44461.1 hypothetical protein G5B38_02360 [Pseudohalocynthiibacter aestuariivivens]